MIHSMTGYGETQYSDNGVAYLLEVRSLNNRYFKATIKLPEHLSLFESEVEKLLRSRLNRGSVSYHLRVRDTTADAAQEINVAALKSYIEQLRSATADTAASIDLAALLTLPGVCQPPEMDDTQREHQWKVIEGISKQAIEHLIQMRETEGRALCEDLVNQCELIRRNLATIAERAPIVLKEYHQRLTQRANELIGEAKLQLQLDDVKREVALYAERCDINEEIARLGSHMEQFEKMCRDGREAGRKLDFLAQEMLRETNTIGSKANDARIAHHIVEIKGAIDRLKEQVQNVE